MNNNQLLKSRNAGLAALFLAAFFWATAFLGLKNLVAATSPFELLAWRFSFAALLLAVIFWKKWKLLNKKVLLAGIKMGVALYVEFLFFTVGIQYTTASKSSFITAGYIVVLPLVYFCVRKKWPQKNEILAALVCMAGLVLILGDAVTSLNKGDFLSGCCALAYAVHIVLSGNAAKHHDGILLNMIQLATGGILAMAVAALTGSLSTPVLQLPWAGIGYLAVFSTILPYLLCLFGQKRVNTTTSGVILSFESVFATGMAVLFLQEHVGIRFVLGGVIVILSAVISSWEPKKKNIVMEERI